MRHRLSTHASRDVERLYRQSIVGFGSAHADQYLDRLNAVFFSIAAFPDASPARAELRGVRIRPYEAHHIIYRIRGNEVVILRILHGRQDVGRYLRS